MADVGIHPETASLIRSIISKSPLGCLWLNFFWCHTVILGCSDCTDAVCFELKSHVCGIVLQNSLSWKGPLKVSGPILCDEQGQLQ